MSINPLCSVSLFHQTHSLREINYVNDMWSHDYAKKKPCGRQSYTQTLRLLPIAKLAFEIDNSETKQKGIRKRSCFSMIAKMVEIQQYNDKEVERNRSNSIKDCTPIDRRLYGEPPKPNATTGTSEDSRKSLLSKTMEKKCIKIFEGNSSNSKDRTCEP